MRKVRIILMIVLSVTLVGLLIYIGSVLLSYKKDQNTYENIRSEYTETKPTKETEEVVIESSDVPLSPKESETEEEREKIYAPITVDFKALKESNPDTIAWLYCEDTTISYPVVYRENDNLYYVEHDFEGTETRAGAVFLDGNNRNGFVDHNNIIYGHSMRDGSMLSCMFEWSKQEYIDEHPCMWLLTPEVDYRLDIFSGYISEAFAKDVFLIYERPSEDFLEYLTDRKDLSMVETDVELDENEHYVFFSTCNDASDYGRFILHAKMVPADTAGGIEIQN